MKKKDLKYIFFLIAFLFLIIFAITRFEYLYGSSVDWITQHYKIPEYFRNLFYETHNLFPDFSLNLGNGQNIYYLSYHGLINPIILFSYLLPFVSMRSYIITTSILSIIASLILLYYWLKNKYDMEITIICSFLFLFATPIIFHSHRHIMFVSYMPFLIMGLYGIDTYFKSKKRGLLTISIFLNIMTSYYYSIGGILCLVIYGVYQYLKKEKNITCKKFLKDGLCFIMPFVIAIIMASILILPTIYTLLNGREDGTTIPILSMLFPRFSISNVLYDSYSTGLTVISIIALIGNFFIKKKENKFLSIVLCMLLIIPIFIYFLNGGLYYDGKVLIPFIPVFIFLIAEFLKYVLTKEYSYGKFILCSIVFLSWVFIMNMHEKLIYIFIIDVFLTLLCLCISKKKNNIMFVGIIVICISFLVTLNYNLNDKLVSNSTYNIDSELEYILKDNSFYRINQINDNLTSINEIYTIDYYTNSIYSSSSNKHYKNYYNHSINNEFIYRSRELLATTQNLLNNIYLGNKYVVASDYNQVGYNKVYSAPTNVYKNEFVFSVGYASSKIMSLDEYKRLNYPYNVDALLNYVIVNKNLLDVYEQKVYPIELEYNTLKNELNLNEDNGVYQIGTNTNNSKLILDLKNSDVLKDKILMIKFDILNKTNNDRFITINGIKNKVTKKNWKYHNKNYEFNYTISSNELINTLEIAFSKGKFEIGNIELYIMDSNEVLSISESHDEFNINTSLTKGDVIVGDIMVTEDSYFNISIPYDKGFNIYVDGVKTNYEAVDEDFIGFPIKKGEHKIEIEYKAPYKKLGLCLSLIGVIIFTSMLFIEKKNTKQSL